MSTKFLSSNCVEVFPSGYRDPVYVKSRSMIEENFTNINQITNNGYRNFAFQDSLDIDNVIAFLSGYRFKVSVSALYDIAINEFAIDPYADNSWNCCIFIKTADHVDANQYGKVLVNLSPDIDNHTESLDEDGVFYGLGVAASANGLNDVSYLVLNFVTVKLPDSETMQHILTNKLLSLSSFNVRNSDDADLSIRDRFDTRYLRLECLGSLNQEHVIINSEATNLNNAVALTISKNSNTNIAGKLAFANNGEVQFSGEADGESALRLSIPGDSTAISAGLVGPGSDSSDTSAKIIYRANDNNHQEEYLKLPKEPIYSEFSDTDELIWVKSVIDGKAINSWTSLDSIINNINQKINNALEAKKGDIDTYLNNSITETEAKFEKDITEIKSTHDTDFTNAYNIFNQNISTRLNDIDDIVTYLTTILSSVKTMEANFIKKAYPIGSIFMSTYSTDPNIQLGVEDDENPIVWEKIESGRYLKSGDYIAGKIGKGGSNYITLKSENLPKHRHPEMYGGDTGEYGNWIVLRNEAEVNAAKLSESTSDTLNFSENVTDGYTDDIARYFSSSYNAGHQSCHPSYRTPRKLYTGPNIGHKGESVNVTNNPSYAGINMWIRVE